MRDRPDIIIVSLCKDNPEELASTLASIERGAEECPIPWSILVVDASGSSECQRIAHASTLPVIYTRQKGKGIYNAMNQALSSLESALVAFMHAGDAYVDGGLTRLVRHWLKNEKPACSFGQAWVQPVQGRSWLTPDQRVTKLSRWMLWMSPCHQAFIFETRFAQENRYPESSIIADRSVMKRAVITTGHNRAYIKEPVCIYRLNGISSELPNTKTLLINLKDHQRSRWEKLAEVIKFFLRPIGRLYPRIMRVRSKLWGMACR
jgi:hypothetical protein